MQDAFAAQSVQLARTSADWTQLKASAAAGQLRMEPGVAEAAAGVCEDMIGTLDSRYLEAQSLVVHSSMGDCNIGQQLATKFNDKATGETNSYTSVIRQHQQLLTDMAATYRAAGQAFRAQEEANAGAVGGSV